MTSKEQIIENLKKVEDPELQLDVWSLGLIYGIDIIDGKTCKITMTLTSPQCPFGPYMMQDVKKAVENAGFDQVDVELTFSPRWKPSDELRAALGIGGV